LLAEHLLAPALRWTNLIGDLPIMVDGLILGAIGAGSGTGPEDLAVARAGATAVAGADMFADFEPMGAEDTGIIRGTAPR
jgi:glc operon protein GlcG